MSTINENLHGFMDKVRMWWGEFNLQTLSEKVGGSSAEAIHAAVYFGVAFISGFLFKKYAKFLLLTLIFMVVTLKVMEYNNLISFHWDTLQTMTGIEVPLDFNFVMKTSFAWVKQNILLTVAAALGFLVGYKLA